QPVIPAQIDPSANDSDFKRWKYQSPSNDHTYEASGFSVGESGWDTRRDDSVPDYKKLYCTSEQRASLAAIYSENKYISQSFTDSSAAQSRAQHYLSEHGLRMDDLEKLESRWTTVTSRRWSRKGGASIKRTLYQCSCGYSNTARATKKSDRNSQMDETSTQSSSIPQPSRKAPFDFTGCLAHVDITLNETSNTILRISGYLTHNDGCRSSHMTRFPAVPLHPHVREVALQQLRNNDSISQIRNRNLDMFERKLYRDQNAALPAQANYRYELQSDDFSRLYRLHYRTEYAIDVSIAPEHNVHNWLDAKSPHFKPEIAQAVFGYSARATQDERFKIFIATPEMRTAAWKYCHQKQLVLDGTFGLCSSRLLLWIAMGIDESRNGVPLAMFLFSAPTGAKATHAGYNTAILTELLGKWKECLEQSPPEPGHRFEPVAAMTDTDMRERGALVATWSGIFLLLCKFHIRQCWTNKRKSVLSKVNDMSEALAKAYVEKRLLNLEEALLQTTAHDAALQLLMAEEHALQALSGDNEHRASAAGLEYLAYLHGTWMPEEMWRSWSRRGREDVAARMGVAVEEVLPTTNHLESFNGTLKRRYIPQWQHSGTRLRFDLLIYHLVVSILPRIYGRQRMLSGYTSWRSSRFRDAAGGVDLLHVAGGYAGPSTSNTQPAFIPRTWWSPDTRREYEGKLIYEQKLLHPISSRRPYELWAICRSSSSPSIQYWLTAHPTGSATCTCPDWLFRGGACKHLRAFRLLIDSWAQANTLRSPFHFPESEDQARELEVRNRCWYGTHYERMVTPTPDTVAPRAASHDSSDPSHLCVATPLVTDATVLPPPEIATNAAVGSLESIAELQQTAEQADAHEALSDSADDACSSMANV
ncbi:hypothetical protein C8Q76DRAFT_806652, partial [Earliella scabrosa]